MIDSLTLAHIYPGKPSNSLLELGFNSFIDQKSQKRKWINNSIDNAPNLTIFKANDGVYRLTASFSLPKVLFGTNVYLPDEKQIKNGLSFVSDYVSEISCIDFDAFTARVFRVHYVQDFRLNENVTAAIVALSRFNLARFTRHTVGDSTVYFESKNYSADQLKQLWRVIRIYDKYLEVINRKNSSIAEIEATKGILRLEYAFNKPKSVNQLSKTLDLQNPLAETLVSETVAKAVMQKNEIQQCITAVNQIGINRLDSLMAHYPAKKAISLSGFLEAVDTFGENFYENTEIDVSRSWYMQKARESRMAGVWQKVNE